MAISSTNKAKLNKMNRAAQNVSLGDLLAARQSTTVTDAQANASAVVIDTGLTSIEGFVVQTYRSGSLVQAQKVTSSGGNITINSGSAVTKDDVINWIAY